MLVRRVFLYALAAAVPILPLWMVLARTYIVGVPSADLPLLVVLAFALAAALALVSLLTWLRKAVRSTRAVSWLDVGILGAWYLSIIVAGLVGHGTITIPVVVLAALAFWSALSQLIAETRRRITAAIDGFGVAIAPARRYRASGGPTPDAPFRGEVIRLEERADPPKHD